MTSPAFSRASSRRSSIGNEDHISSKYINRDPFKDATKQDVSVPTPPRKYATNSLPRNFSLRPDPLINLDEQKESPIAEERGKICNLIQTWSTFYLDIVFKTYF